MNKRGNVGDNPLMNNTMYFIIFIVFLSLSAGFIYSQKDGVLVWEDFYAKEIARVVDVSSPGTEVFLDVTKATEIAKKKGQNFDSIFSFDNENNRVIVSLRSGSGKSFGFFNNVNVSEWRLDLVSGGAETNRLYFKIDKSEEKENE